MAFLFLHELIRRHKKWVLLKDASDDHHGMGAEDVYDDAGAKLGEVVCSDNRVIIFRQHVIQARLEFYDVVHARALFQ